MARICPKCGNKLKEKSTFCGKCGSKWIEPDQQKNSPEVKQQTKTAENEALGFIKKKKKWFIGIGAALLAVVLLLMIINPANSPESVFNRYLDCLRSRNSDAFRAASYEANFAKDTSADNVVASYEARFSSADTSYKSGGRVNLLTGKSIRITKAETPTQAEIASRVQQLDERYRNAYRVTDIRNITFEIKQGEIKSTGTAEMICVTGKWYIGDVTGI